MSKQTFLDTTVIDIYSVPLEVLEENIGFEEPTEVVYAKSKKSNILATCYYLETVTDRKTNSSKQVKKSPVFLFDPVDTFGLSPSYPMGTPDHGKVDSAVTGYQIQIPLRSYRADSLTERQQKAVDVMNLLQRKLAERLIESKDSDVLDVIGSVFKKYFDKSKPQFYEKLDYLVQSPITTNKKSGDISLYVPARYKGEKGNIQPDTPVVGPNNNKNYPPSGIKSKGTNKIIGKIKCAVQIQSGLIGAADKLAYGARIKMLLVQCAFTPGSGTFTKRDDYLTNDDEAGDGDEGGEGGNGGGGGDGSGDGSDGGAGPSNSRGGRGGGEDDEDDDAAFAKASERSRLKEIADAKKRAAVAASATKAAAAPPPSSSASSSSKPATKPSAKRPPTPVEAEVEEDEGGEEEAEDEPAPPPPKKAAKRVAHSDDEAPPTSKKGKAPAPPPADDGEDEAEGEAEEVEEVEEPKPVAKSSKSRSSKAAVVEDDDAEVEAKAAAKKAAAKKRRGGDD